MNRIKYVMISTLLLTATNLAFAGDITAGINHLQCSSQSGECSVYIKAQVPNITCQYKDILTWKISDPMGKEFLSMILSYKVANKDVFFSSYTGCAADGTAKLDFVRLQ